jgi:hypothetical protein
MPVRPVMVVPPSSDTWEVHKGAGDEAQARADVVRKSLYAGFTLKSEADFLATLSDKIEIFPYDEPKDASGKKAAAALFKEWRRIFADGVVDAEDVWAIDGHVVIRGTFTGKHVGAWGPVKPTNKTFTSHFLDIAKADKDGKIERVWSYANNYELLKHLGYQKTEVVAAPPTP